VDTELAEIGICESVHLLQIEQWVKKTQTPTNPNKKTPHICLSHTTHVERTFDRYQSSLPQACWKLLAQHQKNPKLPKIVARSLDPVSAEINENFDTQIARRINIKITKCVIEIITL